MNVQSQASLVDAAPSTTRDAAEPIVFDRVTGRIGAEVTGVDLTKPLSPAQIEILSAGVVEHKVLFFRDQDISQDQHRAFARCFGPLEVHPFNEGSDYFFNDRECREIIVVESHGKPHTVADSWHSDLCSQAAPPMGGVLRCKVAPPFGGDTLWADMTAAYEGLDDATKSLISGLTAVNDWHNNRQSLRDRGMPEERIAALVAEYPPHAHPVVRTHPVSGKKILYVNGGFTTHIVGMSEAESRALLDRLFLQATVPEYQVRFRWRKDSVAFWDNRQTQHYVAPDFYPHHRWLERVTISGDKPF